MARLTFLSLRTIILVTMQNGIAKVNDIKYVRADIFSACGRLKGITEELASASPSGMAGLRAQALELSRAVSTAATLAEIRFAQDTTDAFYLDEKNYYDEQLPHFNAESVKFEKAFLKNPNLPKALEKLNPNIAKVYELSIKAMDERIIPESALESKLATEYATLMSGLTFRWRGKSVPLSALTKYMDDSDREVRRSASGVLGKKLGTVSGRLDSLFDELVKVRARKAKKMNVADYSVLGDMLMNRYSYGRAEIAKYRERVAMCRVPEVAAQKAEIAARLKLGQMMLYDNEVYFEEGNPEPKGGADGIFAAAREMYTSLGDETREFFAYMEKTGAFDVMPRRHKWGGGFCTHIDGYAQPFILANFNGSAGDVDVLTHEAGHALAFYLLARSGCDYELTQTMTMSVAEVHSMAMEYFAHRFADRFFSRADDYRKMHYDSSVTFLPYGCLVDEFEETCYRNPDMSPAERNGLWLTLEKKYRPHLSAEGIPYLERGTRWQYQSHIYEAPMYYIDYCLAGEVALNFYQQAQSDYTAAFAKYMKFMRASGELPFSELCRSVGVRDPLAF